DFLYVSGGIGVGAGIVLGGRLFGGSGGRAGGLGGGYPRLGAVLRAAVADELARRVVWRSSVAVRTSALGAAAALRGAATSVVRAVLDG
ncbi:MAG TPA: ROK family transcriptional regulator, partial [Pseudonocardia sp.]|nr:ROK family transcriptional regulator [Pseudonocardia sp.]